jgi:CO/xanthine dehydrogenase FAD-binding subunit
VGGNVCNASPCGDTLAPLVALGARFVLSSSRGERQTDAESFFTGPKLTVREHDEVLTEILIPEPFLAGSSAFRMIGKRNGQAISQVNLAVWLRQNERSGAIEEIRAAAGSVAPVPLRLSAAEQQLHGHTPERGLLDQAQAAVSREIRPISDVRTTEAYRRSVSSSLFREALEEALAHAFGPSADEPRRDGLGPAAGHGGRGAED